MLELPLTFYYKNNKKICAPLHKIVCKQNRPGRRQLVFLLLLNVKLNIIQIAISMHVARPFNVLKNELALPLSIKTS